MFEQCTPIAGVHTAPTLSWASLLVGFVSTFFLFATSSCECVTQTSSSAHPDARTQRAPITAAPPNRITGRLGPSASPHALAARAKELGWSLEGERRQAACDALGLESAAPSEDAFPYGIYTLPEISVCGRSEEELTKAGVAYEIGKASYREIARGQILGDEGGLLKLMFDADGRSADDVDVRQEPDSGAIERQ